MQTECNWESSDDSPSASPITATGSNDTTAKLWDISTGKPLATFRASSSATYGIDFSPDGKLLVTSSWGRSVRLWNVPK